MALLLLMGGVLSLAPEPFASFSLLTRLAVVPACQRIWELSSVQAREANAAFRARHLVVTLLGLLLWSGVIASYVYPEQESDPYGDYGY